MTYMGSHFNCRYLTVKSAPKASKQQNNESSAMLTIPSKPLPSRIPSCSLHW